MISRRIKKLEFEIAAIKIELNSTYGGKMYVVDYKKMIDDITELKREVYRLKQIELRKQKIEKIQSNLCQK